MTAMKEFVIPVVMTVAIVFAGFIAKDERRYSFPFRHQEKLLDSAQIFLVFETKEQLRSFVESFLPQTAPR